MLYYYIVILIQMSKRWPKKTFSSGTHWRWYFKVYVPERSCAISLKPLLRRFLSSRGMFGARPLVSVDRPALGFASECCLWICKAAGSRSTIITIIIVTVKNHHQHHHFLTMSISGSATIPGYDYFLILCNFGPVRFSMYYKYYIDTATCKTS